MQSLFNAFEFLRTPLAFLFVLGVLVFVHEFGHFIVARLHGVRVLTFSLGFGPKLIKFRRGDTEYCVSAVPLGGYVKLAGETVEDTMSGAPDEFLSQTKWVRFQVYLAGPVMNVILAVIVLAGVYSRAADVPAYDEAPAVIGAVLSGSAAERGGLQAGDRVLTVNGAAIPTWSALDMAVVMRAGRELPVTVDRGGQRLDLRVTPDSVGKYEAGVIGVVPVTRPQIRRVVPGTPAAKAGFQAGDVIVAVDGKRDLAASGAADETVRPDERASKELTRRIQAAGTNPIVFTVERTGQEVSLTAAPEGGRVGIDLLPYEYRQVDLTIPQALAMSVNENWKQAKMIGTTLKGLVTRDTPMRQLTGPVGIASLSGEAASAGWLPLMQLLALISLNLGLFNLLPLPVLDGGHIAILAVEGLSRRDLSLRVKERILMAGVALIAVLMVTVIFNDISRLMR